MLLFLTNKHVATLNVTLKKNGEERAIASAAWPKELKSSTAAAAAAI